MKCHTAGQSLEHPMRKLIQKVKDIQILREKNT